MSELKCIVITCDRCSKDIRLKFIRTESFDYGESHDIYENVPDDWMWQSQIGNLCPDCAREFQLFVLGFMNGDATKIAPGWKYALTRDDLMGP